MRNREDFLRYSGLFIKRIIVQNVMPCVRASNQQKGRKVIGLKIESRGVWGETTSDKAWRPGHSDGFIHDGDI